jgi:alkylation response protein AidB-like acyl-CoA dehydrogenase
MDFSFTPEQQLLKDTARTFLQRQAPMSLVRSLSASADPFDYDLWQYGAELGWSALTVPEDYGGVGLGIIELVAVAEEQGRAVHPGPFIAHSTAAYAIATFASDLVRERVLGPIADGTAIATWALAEPHTELETPQLTAKPTCDGHVLRGTKTFVQDATRAKWLILTARGPSGPVQFLIELPTAHVTVETLRTLDLTRVFCEVGIDELLIGHDASFPTTQPTESVRRQLQLAQILTCADTLGSMEKLLEMTLEHLRARRQFGRPIGSFQALKHRAADMRIRLDTSRVATYYAAMAFSAGANDLDHAVAIAKSFVGDAASWLAGEALQLHGGVGFTWDHDLHFYLRRVKTNQVLYGDPISERDRLIKLVLADELAKQ